MIYILDTIEQLKILKDRLVKVEKDLEKSKDFKLNYEIKTLKFSIKTLANKLVEEVENDKYYLRKIKFKKTRSIKCE